MNSHFHAARAGDWCAFSRNGACPSAMSRLQAANVLRELRHCARRGAAQILRIAPGSYQAVGRETVVLQTRLMA